MDAKSNTKIIPQSLTELIEADLEKYRQLPVFPVINSNNTDTKYDSKDKKDTDCSNC